MNTYTVSICVPTLGRAEKLNELLQCIGGQLWALPENIKAQVEICVSDNCSPDETQAVLLRFRSLLPHFKTVRQAVRVGFAENLEAAIGLAAGTFIWIMGDDDLLMPGALAKVIAFLNHPDRAHTRLVLVNEIEFDRGTGHFIAQHDRNPTKAYTAESSLLEDCVLEGFGHISRLILRRETMSRELYAARRSWDIMPFLRWVVAAMSEGRHDNIGEVLVIACYVPDNPNAKGRWMFCYACEIPELIQQIRRTCRLSARADRRLLPVQKYLKGYFQLSLLRDRYHEAWSFAKSNQPRECLPRWVAKGMDIFWASQKSRTLGARMICRLKPSFGQIF